MPAYLEPPRSLADRRYVVVRYSRDTESYELVDPNEAKSYNLGHARQARAYLERQFGEALGGRALDAATAFGASQTIPRENRAFGLDLTKVDAVTRERQAREDVERLLGEDYLDDEFDDLHVY